MANIYMTIYGREGMKDLAKQNLAKAAYARRQFARKAKVLFEGSPRFNEFVVQTTEDSYEFSHRLNEKHIVGGFPLKKFYPELGNAAVWCCTELNTKEAIDAAVAEVK
jgi:glycine dehydrogenase subunit 1